MLNFLRSFKPSIYSFILPKLYIIFLSLYANGVLLNINKLYSSSVFLIINFTGKIFTYKISRDA